uniref:Ovule protein n=1 Tax=Heterorhabditis bacteriophora TaxID=37862 RepID=A0A1I7X1W9_HETBA
MKKTRVAGQKQHPTTPRTRPKPSNMKALEAQISVQRCPNLVDSMPRRCAASALSLYLPLYIEVRSHLLHRSLPILKNPLLDHFSNARGIHGPESSTPKNILYYIKFLISFQSPVNSHSRYTAYLSQYFSLLAHASGLWYCVELWALNNSSEKREFNENLNIVQRGCKKHAFINIAKCYVIYAYLSTLSICTRSYGTLCRYFAVQFEIKLAKCYTK